MALVYIDRHLVHEVTSPQAFEGLKLAGRKPWRIGSVVATADHNTPTDHWDQGITDPVSRLQVETLDANIAAFGSKVYFPFRDARQGIVHVIGPEQGATLPGMTVVCGDSHTSTHGAFACLAQGIGTSEVEHVLATQCLLQKKSKTMLIRVEGALQTGVSAKDVVLAIIGAIGTAGGTGYAIEFAGSTISALSMEGRMTISNMAIEAGARAGMVAADEKTIAYVEGRPQAPKNSDWEQAVAYWRTLHSDDGAPFDAVLEFDAAAIKPQVTWGTSPEMVLSVEDRVPDPADAPSAIKKADWERALAYMGLCAGTPIAERRARKRSASSSSGPNVIDATSKVLRTRALSSTRQLRTRSRALASHFLELPEFILNRFRMVSSSKTTPSLPTGTASPTSARSTRSLSRSTPPA